MRQDVLYFCLVLRHGFVVSRGWVKTGLNGLIMVRNPWVRIFTAKTRQNPPQQLEHLALGRAQLELAPSVMRHEMLLVRAPRGARELMSGSPGIAV